MERFSRGLPGVDPLLAELVLLLRRGGGVEFLAQPRVEFLCRAARAFALHEHRAAERMPLAGFLLRPDR